MDTRSHVVVAALVAALAVGVSACSSPSEDTSAAGADHVTFPSATSEAAAVPDGRHLDPTAFATAIKQPGTVVLDVRTPAEYAAGHIATARNLDVQSSDFPQQVAALDKTASYAVYCHSGKRSAAAVQLMGAAGLANVVDLSGGVTAWTAAGNPLVTG
jgi:rhodanese-related sulfurtransferase